MRAGIRLLATMLTVTLWVQSTEKQHMEKQNGLVLLFLLFRKPFIKLYFVVSLSPLLVVFSTHGIDSFVPCVVKSKHYVGMDYRL